MRNIVHFLGIIPNKFIFSAVKTLFLGGFVVEPSGAAAFAALQSNKIPNVIPGGDVVVMITGGNITPDELCNIIT